MPKSFIVAIASTNPAKTKAVEDAFAKVFPDQKFEFQGFAVDSKVNAQPMSSAETLLGATNRLEHLKELTAADYYVALEGGVEYNADELYVLGHVVMEHQGYFSRSQTARFRLPHKIVDLIKQGHELAEADNIVFNRSNSGQGQGAIGLLTNNLYTRSTLFEEAVCYALIPYFNKELYFT